MTTPTGVTPSIGEDGVVSEGATAAHFAHGGRNSPSAGQLYLSGCFTAVSSCRKRSGIRLDSGALLFSLAEGIQREFG